MEPEVREEIIRMQNQEMPWMTKEEVEKTFVKPNQPTVSILAEAEEIINGPRRDAYGPVEDSFQRVATVWSQILRVEVKPRQVAQCMIGLKVLRDANTPQRDALVDICGYAALADKFPPPATVASNSTKEGSSK